jgi:hypothetical protein
MPVLLHQLWNCAMRVAPLCDRTSVWAYRAERLLADIVALSVHTKTEDQSDNREDTVVEGRYRRGITWKYS